MSQKFTKGSNGIDLEYPISRSQASLLNGYSSPEHSLISVREGDSHGYNLPMALCNDQSRKEALNEILKVREEVENDIFPKWFMEKYYPEDWGTFPEKIPEPLANAHNTFNLPQPLSFDDPKGLANVVHMDHTTDLSRVVLNWLISEKADFKNKAEKGFNFLAAVPDQHEKLNRKIKQYMDMAFEMKWYFGVPRPEEVAGKNITAYPEGSPSHASLPAGHGAAAFATAIHFLSEWNLTTEQKKTVYDSAYIWSMARSLAGVHYAVDNLMFAPRYHEFA